jgi:CheY-like chemotaxis protein
MTDLQPLLSAPAADLLDELNQKVALLATCLGLAEDALIHGDLESARQRIGLAARAAQQAQAAAELQATVEHSFGFAAGLSLDPHVPVLRTSKRQGCFQLTPPSMPRRRSLSSQRVLVVEDSPSLREMIALILRREGHVVDTVALGTEALEHLEKGQYDVIISDVSLGSGLSGLDLAYAVQQISPRVRFILATAAVEELSPVERGRLGVDRLLNKPFTPAQLRHAVAND